MRAKSVVKFCASAGICQSRMQPKKTHKPDRRAAAPDRKLLSFGLPRIGLAPPPVTVCLRQYVKDVDQGIQITPHKKAPLIPESPCGESSFDFAQCHDG